jgi:FtsZ-binding cell division protein ZapB
MQETELNRATIRVVNRTDIRGRGTADEINRSYRTEKERSLWRIGSLTFLGTLTVAGFFVLVAPLPARADDDKDRHRGHEDNDKGIRAEIAALQAQVAALQDQVNKLQTANTDQQNEIDSLQTSNTGLQTQLAAVQSNHALLLGPFVSVDPDPEIGVIGPNIIFSGANIHIVSGSGSTDDGMLNNPSATLRGLGNLIIGYNEDPGKRPGGPEAPPPILGPGDRSGSHNLVIGRWNRFTKAAFGGLVAGEANIISNEGAGVSGGFGNTASGFDASVVGGVVNTASGNEASVIGGQNVTANNNFSIAPQPPFP